MRSTFQLDALRLTFVIAILLSAPVALYSSDSTEKTPPGADQGETAQEFEGVSNRRSYEEALADALRQMDKAVAEHGKDPCTLVSWRVIDVRGKSGSPAGLNTLQVKIAATFETRKSNPLGMWKVTRTTTDHEFAGFTLAVTREDDKLTGTVKWADGSKDTAAVEFKDGILSVRVKPASVIHQYSGKLSGDTVKGKWAAGIAVFDWEAKRESKASDCYATSPPASP